jgi:hypothetical protein
MLLLASCSTPRGAPSDRIKKSPDAPKPVLLAPLPDYGPEQSDYNNSARCLLIHSTEDPAVRLANELLRAGLERRGYSIAELQPPTSAEERARIDKTLSIEYIASRSTYLPQSDQTVIDTFIVLALADAPRSLSDRHKRPRFFQAFGRDPDGLPQGHLKGASNRSIEQALNNLFTLDPFRKALEPTP